MKFVQFPNGKVQLYIWVKSDSVKGKKQVDEEVHHHHDHDHDHGVNQALTTSDRLCSVGFTCYCRYFISNSQFRYDDCGSKRIQFSNK